MVLSTVGLHLHNWYPFLLAWITYKRSVWFWIFLMDLHYMVLNLKLNPIACTRTPRVTS